MQWQIKEYFRAEWIERIEVYTQFKNPDSLGWYCGIFKYFVNLIYLSTKNAIIDIKKRQKQSEKWQATLFSPPWVHPWHESLQPAEFWWSPVIIY